MFWKESVLQEENQPCIQNWKILSERYVRWDWPSSWIPTAFRPEVLKRLCEQGLIDYAAMDIKAGRANYSRACGVPGISLAPIEESVSFLLSGAVPCEFRTTVVRELHSEEDFVDIAQWINGCSSYFLQSYQDSENVLTPGFSACSKEELLRYLDIVRPCAKTVQLRGVD